MDTVDGVRGSVTRDHDAVQGVTLPGETLRHRLKSRLAELCDQAGSAYSVLIQSAALQNSSGEVSSSVDEQVRSTSVSLRNLLGDGQLWLAATDLIRAVHELATLLEQVRLLLLVQGQVRLPVEHLSSLTETAAGPAPVAAESRGPVAPELSLEIVRHLLEHFQA
jgi:hypothetical protein